jgi:hypothetical protein
MIHASLSPEGLIQTGLRSIDCSHREFAEIAVCMSVPVSHSLISSVFRGERAFNSSTADALLSLLKELLGLRDYFSGVPIAWDAGERIATLIVKRRMQEACADVDRAAAVQGLNNV